MFHRKKVRKCKTNFGPVKKVLKYQYILFHELLAYRKGCGFLCTINRKMCNGTVHRMFQNDVNDRPHGDWIENEKKIVLETRVKEFAVSSFDIRKLNVIHRKRLCRKELHLKRAT